MDYQYSLDAAGNVIKVPTSNIYLKAQDANGSSLLIPQSELVKPSFDVLMGPNITNRQMRTWRGMLNTGGGSGSTWSLICKAPATYRRVRMFMKCLDATPGTITGALVAPTANNTDKVTPTVGSGLTNDAGATGWSQVTWQGSNSAVLPTRGTDSDDAGVLFSDWVDLDSVAPTDGTVTPYLMARLKISGAFSSWYMGSPIPASTSDNTKSCYHVVYNQGVDGITTPTNMTQAGSTIQGNSPFFGFEFETDVKSVRVMCVGDSITVGQGSDGSSEGIYSWVSIAEDYFKTNNIPINLFPYAWGGQTTSQYSIFGKRAVTAIRPTICMYSVFSPNDGSPSAALSVTEFRRAMDFAHHCMQHDVVPVFTFLAPNDNYSVGTNAFRQALVAQCQASGIATIDMSVAISQPPTNHRFATGMRNDAVHPSSLGYQAMAQIAQTGLLNLVKKNFSL